MRHGVELEEAIVWTAINLGARGNSIVVRPRGYVGLVVIGGVVAKHNIVIRRILTHVPSTTERELTARTEVASGTVTEPAGDIGHRAAPEVHLPPEERVHHDAEEGADEDHHDEVRQHLVTARHQQAYNVPEGRHHANETDRAEGLKAVEDLEDTERCLEPRTTRLRVRVVVRRCGGGTKHEDELKEEDDDDRHLVRAPE
mmetsp:Transcript_17589/g.45872  ORF Transcript_17589/g.45872 Transcript_17589/m.45872 type:complete len:200 (-) Transcript_17589:525-1124(-)